MNGRQTGGLRPARVLAAAAFLFVLGSAGALAQDRDDGRSAYLAMLGWLHRADVLANLAVTHEVCGWGTIDLRPALLSRVMAADPSVSTWDVVAARYDATQSQRRYLEATLTANGHHDPYRRHAGLYPTEGCSPALRERIEGVARGAAD